MTPPMPFACALPIAEEENHLDALKDPVDWNILRLQKSICQHLSATFPKQRSEAIVSEVKGELELNIYITRTLEKNNPGEAVLRRRIAGWRQDGVSAWNAWRTDDYHWYQERILEAEQLLSQCAPGPNPGEYTIKITTAEFGDRGHQSRSKPYCSQHREHQFAASRAEQLVSRAANFMTTCLVH